VAAASPQPVGPPAVRLHPLAGLLVLLVAVLSPLLSSAASASAARPVGRTTATASSTSALTTAPGSSAGQHDRRGLRTAMHRAGPSAGRRQVEESGEARTVHAQPAGHNHLPSTPGTCSADPTGPPSTYDVALLPSRDRHLGGRQHRAAVGRAPPTSCGS
jgi:hypothetical protein